MRKFILSIALVAMAFLSIGQTVTRKPYYIPSDLDVAGGVKLRNTSWAVGGVVKFASGHFYGYTGTEWVRLDSLAPAQGTQFWSRSNSLLSPITTGDGISVATTSRRAISASVSTGEYDAIYGLSSVSNGVRGDASASGNGVLGTSASGNGVWGTSTSGNGVFGSSVYGSGLYGFSQDTYGGSFWGNNVGIKVESAGSAASVGGIELVQSTSGTAAPGIGSGLSISTERSNGSGGSVDATFNAVMTDVSAASASADFEWALRDKNQLETKMTLSSIGRLTVGSLNLSDGSPNKWLATDANNNIIYMDPSSSEVEQFWVRDADIISPYVYGERVYNIVESKSFSIKGSNDTGYGVSGVSTSSDGVRGDSYSGNGVSGISTTGVGVSGNGGLYGLFGQTTGGHGVSGSTNTGVGVSAVARTTGTAVSATANTGRGVYSASTSGDGGYFQSSSGAGLSSVSGSGYGVSSQSTSNLAYYGVSNPTSTNSVHSVMNLTRSTSGTAAVGIGGGLIFSLEQANGTISSTGSMSNIMTNVTTGSESSKFEWALRNAGSAASKKMELSGTGKLTVDSIRLSAGQANKWLALDANRNIKYMDEPTGGGGTAVYDSIYWRRIGTETEGTIFPKVELDKVRLGDELNYSLLSGDGIEIFDDANNIHGTIDVNGDRLNLYSSDGVSLGVESNVANIVVSNASGDLNTTIYGGVTLDGGTPEKWLALNDVNEVVYMSPPEGAINVYEDNLSVLPVESYSAGPKFGVGQDSTHYTLPTTSGGTIYVDPSLTPPGSGTLSSPYNSWALVSFQSNRTYCQKRGTKFESAVPLPEIDGVGPVIITAYGDPKLPKPVIKYTGTSDVDFIHFDNSYGVISNLDIQSIGIVGNGVMIRGGDPYTYVYNCDIKGFSVGVYAYPENNTQNDAWEKLYILYNEIHGQSMDGIYVDDVTDMEIAHNNIYDVNRNYEINPFDQNVAGGDCVQIAVGGLDNILKFSVHHNTFDRSSSGNKFGFIWAGQGGQTTGELRSNIFTGVKGSAMNSVSGLYMGVTSDTIWVTNNLFKNVGNACFTENSNVVASYNVVENCLVGFSMRDAGRGYTLFNNIINRYDVAAVSRLGGYLTSYNNIFMPTIGGLARVYSGVSGTFVSDYNYMTGLVTSTQNLSAWRAATTNDDNTLSSGALLSDSINTGRPLSGSPLLEAGFGYRTVNYDGSLIDSDFVGDYVPSLTTSIGPFQNAKAGSSYYIEEQVLSQYGGPVVIGDYASGNYVKFNKDGAMTFHGKAAYPPGGSNPAVAKGTEGELQYYRAGIVGYTTGLGFVSNVLSSPGNMRGGVVTLAADATGFSVTSGMTFVTSANSVTTNLGNLTGETSAIGAYITIVCGSATNATGINDAAPYYLTANWRPDSIGDNITLLVAADNTYYEVSRSNN